MDSVRLAAAISVMTMVVACTAPPPRPTTVYEPNLVGPITELQHNGLTSTYTVRVRDQTFDIGPEDRSLMGSPGGSDSLLIYGRADGAHWYVSVGLTLTGDAAGCYSLQSINAWDAGESILFGFPATSYEGVQTGVLLPKSEGWKVTTTPEAGGRYPTALRGWCLDSHGRVISVAREITG